MDTLSAPQWRTLAESTEGPCASVYMPTFPGRPEEFQDHVRLKNLLERVEAELVDHGLRPDEARRLVDRGRALSETPEFWHDRQKGLALFLSPKVFLALRIPIAVAESEYVGRRFRCAALLPLVTEDRPFYVLALSQKQVKLYQGTRWTMTEIPGADLPTSLKESLNYQPVTGRGQVHTGSATSVGKAGSIHHGQGGVADAHEVDLEAFFRQVDAALVDYLGDSKTPVVLASTEANLSHYRSLSKCGNLAPQAVTGNVDYLSTSQLHEQAWPAIESLLKQRLALAKEEYGDNTMTGRASREPEQVIPAAIQGRVKTLFLDRDALLWGVFDEKTQTILTHGDRRHEDDDLFDRAAVATALQHGEVFVVEPQEGPSSSPIAAVYRY